MRKILSVILLCMLIILSASCGSGGGGDNGGNNNEPTTYSITGQIVSNNTGLAGVTVSLSGASSAHTTTDSSGYYSFTSQANGNYIVTPSLSGYVFSPSGTSVTIDDLDKAGIDFTATASTTPTYSISGNVSGAVSSGVTITLLGTNTASTLTDSSGNYSFSGLANGSYTVTPSKTGYSLSPPSIGITVDNANISGQNFISTAITTPTYSISGTVSGAVASGVTITLTGTSTGSTTTDSSGNYSFSNLVNGNYTLTASKTGYSFSPVRIVTVSNANVTGQNFTATANTTPAYTISGNVSGAISSGVTITLTGSGSSSTTTDSSGNYSFAGAANGSYTITASKIGYTFSPTSISVTVNNTNVTGKNFTAASAADTTAPTTPTGLSATAASATQINLSWDVTTDNVRVAGYKIYRGGVYLKSVTGNTASDIGLSSSSSYCYTVFAYDAANNESSQSTQACSKTHFTKQIGTTTIDEGNGVAADSSGNVYVVGFTGGNLDGNTNAGDDMFLVKYNAAGTKQWTRQLGTSSTDGADGVAVDSNGNIYVTGFTLGSLDGNTSAGDTDIFLVKYNSAGTKQWTRQLGSASVDVGTGIAVDSSGNVYVTGGTWGSLDGNSHIGPSFYPNIFLVKYNAAGTKQWTRQLGSQSSGNGVAVDSSGGIYIAGGTWDSLDGNTNAGGGDIFLVKYDSSGTIQWTRQLGSASDDEGNSIAIDSSGNVYITGYTLGNLDGNTNSGGYDIVLVKFNVAGTKQWTRQLGTDSLDEGTGVAVDTSGNVYVTGFTLGALDGNARFGGYDMFLMKYNNTGTNQWTQQLGTTSVDEGTGVAVDSSGNIYVTGYTTGNLDGNTSAGSTDRFLVKYNSNGVIQ